MKVINSINRTTPNKSVLSTDYNDENEVLGAIQQIWETRESHKYPLERQWYMAVAWYLGLQNTIWSDTIRSLTEQDAPDWRVRIVVNHLQPMVRIIRSKLQKEFPEWDVLPASSDANDAQKAYVANQILSYNWERTLMGEKIMELTLWFLVTGNSFLKQTWDPTVGEPAFVRSIDSEFDIEDSEDSEDTVGEIDTQVISPFEMIVDPRAIKFRDASWCLHSKLVDIQDIIDMYPNADIRPTEAQHSFRYLQFQENIKTLFSREGRVLRGATTHNQNNIMVHELWIKPRPLGKNLKNGRLVVMANNKILKNIVFPYLHGELPFAHFYEVEVPGRLWGTSVFEQMMPLQASYNRSKSQLIEIRNQTLYPKYFIPKGAGISQGQVTDRPGEHIYHNPGFRPEIVNPPGVPSYIQNMLQQDRLDMEDISGVHEVSRAEAPGQIRSGRGVLALVEQDETRQAPVIRHIENQLGRIGRQNLALSAQFVTERRVIRVVGAQDELLVIAYRGSDLVGANSGLQGISYFDVRVKTIVGMPSSRAAQMDLLSSLMQNKVLDVANPKEKRLILQMLSLGSVQNTVDKSRVHRSRQLMEIERIISGDTIQALQWHDHEVHIEMLDEFRNSARYDTLDDDIKIKLEVHAQTHKEWIAYNAVEPEILTRKAAAVAVMVENINNVINILQQTQGASAPITPGVSNAEQQPIESNGLRGIQNGGESLQDTGQQTSEVGGPVQAEQGLPFDQGTA